METADKELGWEDVGGAGPGGGGMASSLALAGALGSQGQGQGGEEVPGIGDAVTSAMVNHFAREISKGSLSMWPQFVAQARRYFNVTHGYVLRKALWQLAPVTSTKKRSNEGELGTEKDWTSRVYEGLEVELEEPDLYMPTMAFVTYVLLCGLVKGLQDQFNPGVLSATVNFAMFLLIVETTVSKAVLFTAGAVNSPTVDLIALLGYKYFYLSLQLMFALALCHGHKPSGFLYHLLALGLQAACGVALWQALRRLAGMQPTGVSDVNKLLIRALPVGQAVIVYFLLPSWPKGMAAVADTAAAVAATAATTVTTVVAEAATNATGAAAAVAAAAAGSAS